MVAIQLPARSTPTMARLKLLAQFSLSTGDFFFLVKPNKKTCSPNCFGGVIGDVLFIGPALRCWHVAFFGPLVVLHRGALYSAVLLFRPLASPNGGLF